jgi:hypothetical protein
MQTILYLKAHWHILIGILIVLGLAAAAYIDWQFVQLGLYGPRDMVGNGITVGLAKAFDNRSLSLRIERLSNSLAQLKVVDQKATENIGKIQGLSSTLSARTLTLDATAGTKPAATDPSQTPPGDALAADGAGKTPATGTSGSKSESKAEVTLAAGDILNEQLNLATQIMNLQTLYERSLTDRLIGWEARLQTVLGFLVSITPPAGFENCVAVVEVAVRMEPDWGSPPEVDPSNRVSLVAMIPQEKTYNAQSTSTNSQSIGGSAVASVVTLGVTSKGESRQLFIHRDSDTVAFERNPKQEPRLFPDDNATVFGWEFRPVLGRDTVTPGMRQMLAVVALPRSDPSENKEYVNLQIKTRSYWRRYDRGKQTSRRKWHWFPQKTDGSGSVENEVQELAVPNTALVQEGLAPKVEEISWVNSGRDRATVIVKGENLFPGTRVLAGGREHREEDGTLTLKSDQALEFDTTVAAIASGDAVLSGRFGRSSQLRARRIPGVRTLYLTRAVIKQSRRGKDQRISIDVKGLDDDGNDTDLETAILDDLPDPVLFVGNEQIPPPYDYWPLEPHKDPNDQDLQSPLDSPLQSPLEPTAVQGETDRAVTKRGEFTFVKASTKKSIRVEAWIPSSIAVNRNSSVMFRVPFCGLEYQSSLPLQFFEPTVTRLGGGGDNTVFRISHSLWHERTVTVEIDRVYDKPPQLVKVAKDDGDYRFIVSNGVLKRYRNLVLRIEGAEPYVISIPEEKPKPKAVVDLNAKPPEVVKGTIGPAEWSGTDLGSVTAATLITSTIPPSTQPTRTPASFSHYDAGKKIVVYFDGSSTNVIGRAEVEFQVGPDATDTQLAPILITNPLTTTI